MSKREGRLTSRSPWLLVAAAACLLAAALSGCGRQSERIVVGSKNFTEQKILGHMFADLIEAHTDLAVERRVGLQGNPENDLESGSLSVFSGGSVGKT